MTDLSITKAFWIVATAVASVVGQPELKDGKSSPASGKTGIIASPAFLKYWKSGLAELSSYTLTVERYGEMRKGQSVLIFVYEEINSDTRIKVESEKTPVAKQIPVLKLNNVIKFNTGVYDYSLMTSVFTGLTAPGAPRPFPPQKISFTSQEWCGHVYQHIIPRPKGLHSEIHSYFEIEGDATTLIPYPKGTNGQSAHIFYEDEMPILLRELDGPFLVPGFPLKIHLVPGLWERRKRHQPLAFTEAVLTKIGPVTLSQKNTKVEATKWTLETMGVTSSYYVESAMPHKLLGWENTRGEKGELIASLRSTYWEKNRNIDEPLREKLGLEFGIQDN